MAIRYSSSFDKTIPFSDTNFQLHLTANNAQTITIPLSSAHRYTILFGMSSNANIFAGYNTTAAVPAGNTNSSTQGVEFITPDSARFVVGGDTVSFVSPDADAYLGVSIRSIAN